MRQPYLKTILGVGLQQLAFFSALQEIVKLCDFGSAVRIPKGDYTEFVNDPRWTFGACPALPYLAAHPGFGLVLCVYPPQHRSYLAVTKWFYLPPPPLLPAEL